MSDRATGYPYPWPFFFARVSVHKEVARISRAVITSCAEGAGRRNHGMLEYWFFSGIQMGFPNISVFQRSDPVSLLIREPLWVWIRFSISTV
jgi:hypothetical protein